MRSGVLNLEVQFGDCDPAGIVYYPNFYRWFDNASHKLAEEAGLGMRVLQAQGYLGLPLMQTGATYLRPAHFGDRVIVHSTVTGFERRSFRVEHRIVRGETVLVEGFEVRFLGIRHPDDPMRVRALDLDEAFRQHFS
jgi:4-hydroxybenzoyl-CoA thioesterase